MQASVTSSDHALFLMTLHFLWLQALPRPADG